MKELDFERQGLVTDSYDYYNDHNPLSIDDINYQDFESDYGVEQLSEKELNEIF